MVNFTIYASALSMHSLATYLSRGKLQSYQWSPEHYRYSWRYLLRAVSRTKHSKTSDIVCVVANWVGRMILKHKRTPCSTTAFLAPTLQGRNLVTQGIPTAMMDISDGLVIDAERRSRKRNRHQYRFLNDTGLPEIFTTVTMMQ